MKHICDHIPIFLVCEHIPTFWAAGGVGWGLIIIGFRGLGGNRTPVIRIYYRHTFDARSASLELMSGISNPKGVNRTPVIRIYYRHMFDAYSASLELRWMDGWMDLASRFSPRQLKALRFGDWRKLGSNGSEASGSVIFDRCLAHVWWMIGGCSKGSRQFSGRSRGQVLRTGLVNGVTPPPTPHLPPMCLPQGGRTCSSRNQGVLRDIRDGHKGCTNGCQTMHTLHRISDRASSTLEALEACIVLLLEAMEAYKLFVNRRIYAGRFVTQFPALCKQAIAAGLLTSCGRQRTRTGRGFMPTTANWNLKSRSNIS